MDEAMQARKAEDASASAQLMQMIFGFMTSQAISVAASLGIADLMRDGAKSVDELALRSGAHAGALYRLMRALASVGVFAEDGERRFCLTPLAEPLRSDAPDSLRAFSIFFGADFHLRVWGELLYSVKHGQPAFHHLHNSEVFEYLERNPVHAEVFNNGMTSLSASVADPIVSTYDFSGFRKLVDVGGGHGYLLAAVLKRYPGLTGLLYDTPLVLNGAGSVLRGVESRCELVAGDFFDSVPPGGDAYMMKHIIHDWEDEKAIKILRNCHRVMDPEGRLLVIEMVVPEGNAPSPSKFLDLEMLLFLRSCERTEKQYRELFKKGGFELTRVVPTSTPYSIVEGVRI
ncbi:MAG TPA: methyltransferase [Candidatus Binatia bacterium]|nr:methyltransferase [Candidatus Binatia bacterium]